MHLLENPFLEDLGVRLTAWSANYAEMSLQVTPKLSNRIGRVQGGVLCTLLDAVCGYAGLYSKGDEPRKQNVSVSLTTNFLNSGVGDQLIAKGWIEYRGNSIYFAKGEVWLDSTLLVATAVGTFKYLRNKSGEGS